MRKIEEIEAELKELPTLPFITVDMIEADTIRLTDELIHAAVDGISLDRLEAICAAEKAGTLVMLPCKVGDTVYLTVHGYVEETKVRTFFIGRPSYNNGEPDPRYEMVRCTNYDLPLKDFGKTVFLTREAAEAAKQEGI